MLNPKMKTSLPVLAATEQLTNKRHCSAQTLTAMLFATTKHMRFGMTTTSNPARKNQESLVCCGSPHTRDSSCPGGPQRLTKVAKTHSWILLTVIVLCLPCSPQRNTKSTTHQPPNYHIVNSFILKNGCNMDRFRYKFIYNLTCDLYVLVMPALNMYFQSGYLFRSRELSDAIAVWVVAGGLYSNFSRETRLTHLILRGKHHTLVRSSLANLPIRKHNRFVKFYLLMPVSNCRRAILFDQGKCLMPLLAPPLYYSSSRNR